MHSFTRDATGGYGVGFTSNRILGFKRSKPFFLAMAIVSLPAIFLFLATSPIGPLPQLIGIALIFYAQLVPFLAARLADPILRTLYATMPGSKSRPDLQVPRKDASGFHAHNPSLSKPGFFSILLQSPRWELKIGVSGTKQYEQLVALTRAFVNDAQMIDYR